MTGVAMDITLIQGAISSLKVAGDIAKSLLELKSVSEIQGKVVELQSAILSAQSSALSANAAQSAMVEEIRALKEEVARVKAWESQKQRYTLQSLWDGAAFVYVLKESAKGSEPPHRICAHCYEDGKRSILQQGSENRFAHLFCPKCGTQLHNNVRHIEPASYA
jgi:hypothetical protein